MGEQSEFRRQHHLIPAALQRPGEEFLVDVRAVYLGGVDQRHAQVDRAVDGADGFGVVAAGPSVGDGHSHRAKADAPDLQAT